MFLFGEGLQCYWGNRNVFLTNKPTQWSQLSEREASWNDFAQQKQEVESKGVKTTAVYRVSLLFLTVGFSIFYLDSY